MTLGSNFSKDVPAKNPNSFVEDKPTQGGSFARNRAPEDNHIPEGDNTGGGVYGGDFGTFGEMYGQDNMGGYTHFKNRTDPPAISH